MKKAARIDSARPFRELPPIRSLPASCISDAGLRRQSTKPPRAEQAENGLIV